MKKNIFWRCGFLILMLLACLQISKTSEAASKYVLSYGKLKIENTTFVTKQQKVGSTYMCKIMMKRNGKKTTLATKVWFAFVTNGKILYYSKPMKQKSDYSWENTIYRYNIGSGKSEKIVSGTNYRVEGCNGTYLYCGNEGEADGTNLYAVNIKTKKKKHMVNYVGNVIVFNEKVLTTTNSGDADNYPIHVFNADGSGKKKITNGLNASIKNGKIYYIKIGHNEDGSSKYRVYSCSLNGKNKKDVTGWVDEYPDEYL